MISKAIHTCFKTAQDRKWDKTYWLFDIHATIIAPNYKYGEIPTEFYPKAKEVLQYLSKRKDICMILYTCSHPEEVEQYLKLFADNDIHFSYVNKNPEVVNQAYGCYDQKPYFNVIADDKAGFDPGCDWDIVYSITNQYPILKKYETK
jgi:hypothetical protein